MSQASNMRFLEWNSVLVKSMVNSPRSLCIGSIDFGHYRTGMAYTCEYRLMTTPLREPLIVNQQLERYSPEFDANLARKIQRVVMEHELQLLVVGLPVLDGRMTQLCNEIVDTMRRLSIRKWKYGYTANTIIKPSSPISSPDDEISCVFVNEADSTMEARERARCVDPRGVRFAQQKDGLAAQIILQRFLNKTRQQQPQQQ